MGQTVEALSSSPTLTSSEEDDNNGDGPNLAEIKNANGTRGNTNSHATTKKGKYKGKGKAANQPQVSAKGDAHNSKGQLGEELHATTTASRTGRKGEEGGCENDNRFGGERIIALLASEVRGGSINRIIVNRKQQGNHDKEGAGTPQGTANTANLGQG